MLKEREPYHASNFGGKERQTRSVNLVGVYLGGGRLKSGEYKALVKFQGIPTAARAINALLQTPEVDHVVALTPRSDLIAPYIVNNENKTIVYKEPGEKFIETVLAALEEIRKNEDIVALFSDIPFVKAKSISRLINTESTQEIVVPAISKNLVEDIQPLHNLHFMPCRNGYFCFGNAVFIKNTAIKRFKMGELQEMYEGKSFRTNPKKKLEVAKKMMGYLGLATAVRIWISANLQHKNASRIDILIPSPNLKDYERMVSKLVGIDSKIIIGRFADLFLDYDYPDDTSQMQFNFESIQAEFDKI